MGNTVGSREPIVVFTARKQQTLEVLSRQIEVLQGSIIGDAYVAPLGKIQIEHTVRQRDYVMWKYRELASISYPSLPAVVQHNVVRSGKTYESLRFWTRQFFRPLRDQFYQGKQKVFPLELELTPLMVAVWYMDDGHLEAQKHRCILATDCFDDHSLKRIVAAFQNAFSINPVLRKSGKLVFNQENQIKFLNVISQHIIPSMKYKVY